MMKIFYAGLTSAFTTMVLHIGLLGCTIIMDTTHDILPFHFFYVLFSISYVLTLDFLLYYFVNLSYRRRNQRRETILMLVLLSAVWHGILAVPLINGNLLDYQDGRYILSVQSDAYVLCSIIALIVAGIHTFTNRKHVSRIVFMGSAIFLPFELIGVLSQFYFHTAYFICATFTTPFFVFYILFHVAQYDEVTGCQRFFSYRNHLKRLLNADRDFLLVSIRSPMLTKSDISESDEKIVYLYNFLSRKVEQIDSRIKVYGISSFNYVMVCPVRNDDEAETVKKQLMDIFTLPVYMDDSVFTSSMHILVSWNHREITDVDEYLSLLSYKSRLFGETDFIQILTVENGDAVMFKRRLFIEKNLYEIQQKNELDDERIQLLIQPIYSIKENDFRTGETLMRMEIEGTTIYPDEFIPLAEEIGVIHMFTRIMLSKAAQQTVLMEKTCDFDALTVNVSTVELTNPLFYAEVLGILRHVGANPERIRLEITESTSITDYSVIIENIKKLSEFGITFYLDDFGTGYSNLDRVIGIPFKTIKFDKSFMIKALEDKKSRELFLLLARFCKANGFSTVVEGVENLQQKEFVEKAGFDYIQGYLYSRPLPAEKAMKFYQ